MRTGDSVDDACWVWWLGFWCWNGEEGGSGEGVRGVREFEGWGGVG